MVRYRRQREMRGSHGLEKVHQMVLRMYVKRRDIHTLVLLSEKGCRIHVTHVHARSDCVHSRDDTDRLTYVS